MRKKIIYGSEKYQLNECIWQKVDIRGESVNELAYNPQYGEWGKIGKKEQVRKKKDDEDTEKIQHTFDNSVREREY